MFKYHERKDYMGSTKNIKWETIEPKPYETQVDSFESALEWLKQEAWWVHDCDGGNDDTYIVGITDNKQTRYFKVFHDFWANLWYDEEDERHFEVSNIFKVDEITKDESKIPSDRDWFNISEYNYKLAKKWPPEND